MGGGRPRTPCPRCPRGRRRYRTERTGAGQIRATGECGAKRCRHGHPLPPALHRLGGAPARGRGCPSQPHAQPVRTGAEAGGSTADRSLLAFAATDPPVPIPSSSWARSHQPPAAARIGRTPRVCQQSTERGGGGQRGTHPARECRSTPPRRRPCTGWAPARRGGGGGGHAAASTARPGRQRAAQRGRHAVSDRRDSRRPAEGPARTRPAPAAQRPLRQRKDCRPWLGGSACAAVATRDGGFRMHAAPQPPHVTEHFVRVHQ